MSRCVDPVQPMISRMVAYIKPLSMLIRCPGSMMCSSTLKPFSMGRKKFMAAGSCMATRLGLSYVDDTGPEVTSC